MTQFLPSNYDIYDIDKKLDGLPSGEEMTFSCMTPYCSAIGGKCAECETIWSECGCHYNDWNCKCGKRVERSRE